jgi:hypothetical protein
MGSAALSQAITSGKKGIGSGSLSDLPHTKTLPLVGFYSVPALSVLTTGDFQKLISNHRSSSEPMRRGRAIDQGRL